jgi:hypothetical protein
MKGPAIASVVAMAKGHSIKKCVLRTRGIDKADLLNEIEGRRPAMKALRGVANSETPWAVSGG